MEKKIFYQCSCGSVWKTREAFLADSDIIIAGYQALLRQVPEGSYLFDHAACHTTFAVKVQEFLALCTGPVHRRSRFKSPQCKGYCLEKNILEVCGADCSNAWVRELIKLIRDYPKTGKRVT